ncbi:Gti1/Pac2 family-domain-containing protein [Catenaria anguillulae PL171]|uniref:Gti1/Pac2 family-domain-containing protein n=1 Tax=Catenaria anguillulae PL171 TaxID=765915 RepID=A0A1Y2H958_9FUNG|nr:Gti1/Pac2 family-domain-containing protein [Catenaria anguillulae PL171]
MRRWTDGKSWSPSRSHGSFLIYRECLPKDQLAAIASANAANNAADSSTSASADQRQTSPSQIAVTDLGNGLQIKHGHRGDYCPLPNGLVKRTISVPVAADGTTYNVVNYVHADDASNAGLPTPSTDRWLCQRGVTLESMSWSMYPSVVNSILLNKAAGSSSATPTGDRLGNAAASLPSRHVNSQLEPGRSRQHHSMSRPRGSSFNAHQGPVQGATTVSYSSSQNNGSSSEPSPWPMAPPTLPQYPPHSIPINEPSVAHHQESPLRPPATYSNPAFPHMPGHSSFASPIPSPPLYAPPTSPLLLSSSAPNLSPISLASRPRSSTASSASSLVMREAWASVQRPAPYPSPRGSCPVSPVRSSDATAGDLELAPILAPIASTRTYPLPAIGVTDRRSDSTGQDTHVSARLGGAMEPVYVEPGWATVPSSGVGYRVGGGRPLSDGSGTGAFRPFPPPV